MTVKLVNESALGIYVFTWQSGPAKRRNVISWFDGLEEPRLEFFISGRGVMSPPTPIRNPERFGFKLPMSLKRYKDFCQKFADACEEESA
jgi:hypothetical protein